MTVPLPPAARAAAALLGTAAAALATLAAAPALADQPLPPLSAVVAAAVARAPQVAMAQARERLGEATQVQAALSRWQNPYFEARAGAVTGQLDAQLDLWLPVETSRQPQARRAEALATRAWLQSNSAVAAAEARGWAVRTWGAAVVAAARVKLTSEVAESAEAEAEALAKRAEARDVREQDAQLARMEAVRTRLLVATATAELARLLNEVGLVLSEPADRCDFPADPLGAIPPPEDASLDRLPAVLALQAEADVYAGQRGRIAAEAQPPWQAMFGSGKGPYGEWRLHAGVAWTPPVTRQGQVEQARAVAEQARARTEAQVLRRQARQQWLALHNEDQALAAADALLVATGRAAGKSAVAAATATWRAGKGDWLQVLTARRSLAELELRHLEMLERRWALRGQWAAWTGGEL